MGTDTDTDTEAGSTAQTWCPSGLAKAPEAVVLGVRSGQDGQVTYLADPVPAAEVLGTIPADIDPARVLRFASHCAASCANRRGDDCTLIERVLTLEPARSSSAVPRCHLRARCQWWQQTGVAACHRCPAVSTANHADDALATLVADPATTPEQLAAWIAAEAEAEPEAEAEARAAGEADAGAGASERREEPAPALS